MTKKMKKVTPLMQQYFDVKSKHPDAILLFRVGDFYETFADDAITTAKVLGIVLTNRNNGGAQIPLAGFPYHSMDMYMPRLVKAGYRVAVCEQLEKPSKHKKIVKRGVTQVVTPGLIVGDQLLDSRKNNFLAAIYFGKKERIGVSFLDISTGEFMVTEGSVEEIDKLLQSFGPSEILYENSQKKQIETSFGKQFCLFSLDDWVFTEDFTNDKLLEKFETNSLKGFGIEDYYHAKIAAGATLHYLENTKNNNIQHISNISRIQTDKYVWLDRFTIRNLEILYSNAGDQGQSLIDVLDTTVSPMGARLLRKWIVLPLVNLPEIKKRQDVVTFFVENDSIGFELTDWIKQVGDIQRLVAKIPLGRIQPREVVQLKKSMLCMPPLKEILVKSNNKALLALEKQLDPCLDLVALINQYIVEEPPTLLAKGNVIAEGVSEELDDLRNIVSNSKSILDGILNEERAKTGMDRLKLGFNNVFGYFFEVTNKYKGLNLIPDNWVRKQTLTNCERYISEELKVLETKILGAQDKISGLENDLYQEAILKMGAHILPVQKNGNTIARLDCLLSFAKNAIDFDYKKPNINDGYDIKITQGRHPVIEQNMPVGERYIPNDLVLDTENQQIILITGPNMAGKSAILRQTALICLMAQMGSFVPVVKAELGLVDKIFTRVGASDNISGGESTFMVEMNETAAIMNNISDRSLLLLDEIGRGTSTFDGISIAWAITEYLHNNKIAHPKTLFATHYHELNELANKFDRIKNFTVAIKHVKNKVIFLRKLIEGSSNHSFGVYVAKMAGMPKQITDRANEVLKTLETNAISSDNKTEIMGKLKKIQPQSYQMSIFEAQDPVADKIKMELKKIDVNSLTPIESLLKLNELVKMLS